MTKMILKVYIDSEKFGYYQVSLILPP